MTKQSKASADRICLGAFAGAHGVRGDVLIKPFTSQPGGVAGYGPVMDEKGLRRFTLRVLRPTRGGFLVASAPEIADREAAALLKGERFYVPRDALPPITDEDEFYQHDLVGLDVVDENGAPAGRVGAIHDFGAGDLLEIRDIPGMRGARVISFTRENAPAVDISGGRLTVRREALQAVEAGASQSLSDETGEIVSENIALDRDAIKSTDA